MGIHRLFLGFQRFEQCHRVPPFSFSSRADVATLCVKLLIWVDSSTLFEASYVLICCHHELIRWQRFAAGTLSTKTNVMGTCLRFKPKIRRNSTPREKHFDAPILVHNDVFELHCWWLESWQHGRIHNIVYLHENFSLF